MTDSRAQRRRLLTLGFVSLAVLIVLHLWTSSEFEQVPEILMVTGIPMLFALAGTVVGLMGALISFLLEKSRNR